MANCKRLFLLSAARVSAKSGLDIVFDESRSFVAANGSYADGAIDIENNCIIINPKSKSRSGEMILIHELDHAIRKFIGRDGHSYIHTYRRAIKALPKNVREMIEESYIEPGKARDEMNAYYADMVFGNSHALRSLIEQKPTLKEKILSHFKKAGKDYEQSPRLSGAAKKYYRTYRKLFDKFSKRNFDNNVAGAMSKKVSDDGSVSDMIVALENGNTYVLADRKVILGNDIAEWRKQITSFFNRLLKGKKSLDITTIDGDVLKITKKDTAKKARDNYKNIGDNRVELTNDEFMVKLHVEAQIDEIAQTSKAPNKTPASDTKNHSFAKDGFIYRKAYFEDFDGQYYEITLSVGETDGVATVYNVGKIKETGKPSAKILAVVGSQPLGFPSNDIIAQNRKKSTPIDKKVSDDGGISDRLPFDDDFIDDIFGADDGADGDGGAPRIQG